MEMWTDYSDPLCPNGSKAYFPKNRRDLFICVKPEIFADAVLIRQTHMQNASHPIGTELNKNTTKRETFISA